MRLLEREDVLARLRESVERARRGDGSIVVVRGEAGIGKTAVASALARDARDTARVLWGACDDLLAARPLGPVWDMAAAEPTLASALAADGRAAVQHALLDVLARSHRPTLAVFEDVHWADGATLDLLTLVGRRIARTHTLLLMTMRDVVADHPLRIVLGDLPGDRVDSLRLDPLSLAAVRRLVQDAERAAQVHELTGGNPFFVSALLAHPAHEVPATVAELVDALVARLHGKAEQLVQLCAAVPGGTEVALLDEIDPDLLASLGPAEDVGLLRLRGQVVEFRHELSRRAVAEGMSPAASRESHRRVLAAGERLGHDTARLAHHARRGGDVDAMVRLLPAAARQAAAERSHREAITQLRALEPHLHLLPADLQADLLELRASEEVFANGTGLAHALAAVDLRRGSRDVTRLGVALTRAARSAWAGGDVAQAIALAEEAVIVLDGRGGEPLARAHAELARLAAQCDDLEAARSHAHRALAMTAEPGPARTIALSTSGFVTNLVSYPEGSHELEEAAAMAESLGLAWELQRARGNLIDSAIEAKDLGRARRLNDAVLASEDLDLLTNKFHLLVGAEIDTAVGHYAAAEQVLRALLGGGRLTTALRWAAEDALARVLVRRGDHAAGAVVARLWERPDVPGHAWLWVTPATLTAQFLWVFQHDDPDTVRRCRAVLARNDDRARTWAVGELALWLWLGGHLGALPDGLPPPLHGIGTEEWGSIADWFADRGLPFEHAVARSRGDDESAIVALRLAQDIGARALAARLRADLRARGVTGLPRGPRRPTTDNPLGLTPRQDEVLDLVAEGRSNAEIAERLFLSVRTVENHVSAILATLDVPDRGAAAAVKERSRSSG